MKPILFLPVLLFFFIAVLPAKAQNPGSPAISVKGGVLFNAANLLVSERFISGPKITVNALWNLNEFVKLGPEIAYFNISNANYIPVSVLVQSYLVKSHTSLFLNTSLGYAFSNAVNETGLNWGGVAARIGLGASVPISSRTDFIFGLDYHLQERKYHSFIYSILTSDMLHLMDVNAGVAFRL